MSVDGKKQAIILAGITKAFQSSNGCKRILPKPAVLRWNHKSLNSKLSALLPGVVVKDGVPIVFDNIVIQLLAAKSTDRVEQFTLLVRPRKIHRAKPLLTNSQLSYEPGSKADAADGNPLPATGAGTLESGAKAVKRQAKRPLSIAYPTGRLKKPRNSLRNSIFESRSSRRRLKLLLIFFSRREKASGTKSSCLSTPKRTTKVHINALPQRSKARLL
jgi:hypothetical protein